MDGGRAFQLPAALANFKTASGQRLPQTVQRKMESLFGTSFDDVRVHVGSQAKSIGALAFTHGSDIHFAPGQYNPMTSQGQRILAHELTHVVQQRAGRARNPFGQGVAVVQNQALEAEADRMSRKAASMVAQAKRPGGATSAASGAPTIQRSLGQRTHNHGNTIQRLILMVGTAGKDAANDFSPVAAKLLEGLTGEKAKALNMYDHPKQSWLASVFSNPTKHTLYITAHGTPDSIVGFDSAKKLADTLKAKNLSSTTLSKIVLVSCSTGAQKNSVVYDPSNFARDLAKEMDVDVYAATDTISVHAPTLDSKDGAVRTPIKFTVKGIDVTVVEGAGLTKFAPAGEGYSPPVLKPAVVVS
jgi:hypothetical protein